METKLRQKREHRFRMEQDCSHTKIITTEDLVAFKQEVLTEFEKLFKSYSTHTQRRWLKAHQVRKLLNISTGTLQTLKSSEVIPYTKMGGVHFFDYENIQRILQDGKNNCLSTMNHKLK
jgi:hypothetical protein